MNLSPHNHKELSKRFFSGASRDLGKERSVENKEFYFDALNMRPSPVSGNYGDMQKIGGQLLDFQYALSSSYFCLTSFFVDTKIVCLWVDENGNLEPVITIDNYIVLRSDELPFELGSHLQYDSDAFQGGGFFTLTNYDTPPLLFDVQDMIDSLGTAKYFTDFRRVNYEINLSSPSDHPVFVELVELSGTSGVKLGQHEYYLRYVSDAGDKTLLSYPSPLIPVPNYYVESDPYYLPNYIYPYLKTRGSDASELNSSYGVKIKFRVNNLFNYDYIEVLRASYSNGEAIGYTPTIYSIKKIAIEKGELSVKEFIDSEGTSDIPTALSSVESQTYLSAIKRAFTLRFYNRRLVLGNVEYDVFNPDDLEFKQHAIGGAILLPRTELLTNPPSSAFIDNSSFSKTVGFKSAYNCAYKKTYMHSEKYGFGVLGILGMSQKTFVKPITGFESYEMPQRRTAMSVASQLSSDSPVEAADVDNVISQTFETFDLEESTFRDTTYDNGYVNIINSGTAANYSPRHPISVDDTRNQHYIRNVTAVRYADTDVSQSYYDPYGYGERYHSLGMSFAGLQSYPDDLKAFALVRTKKAGRVICQGLATYSFDNLPFTSISKKRDEVIFYSPDIFNGVVSPAILSNIANNPSSYKILIQSPVGFFMDNYNSIYDGVSCYKNDMILGCNVYAEFASRRINLGEAATAIGVNNGTDGFTAFGKWRNAAHGAGDSIFGDGENGAYEIQISEFEEVVDTEAEGVSYFRIKLSENIYKTTSPAGAHFNQNSDFFEPFYIISIIDESKEVQDSNVVEYLPTEHYQKIESLIGRSNGEAIQAFELVDERPDDVCVIPLSTQNKFIEVEYQGVRGLYINVTEKSALEIADIDADIANETDLFCGEFLSGKFKTYYEDGVYYVSFDSDCTTPSEGALLYVLYDNRFPITFFGGDSYTGNCFFPRIHRETHNSDELDTNNEVSFLSGFPYYVFDLNPDIIITRTTDPIDTQSGAGNTDLFIGWVRQMICSFICTSYSNIPMAYNEHFPLVNYIPRPSEWIETQEPSEQNIYLEYEEDFPNEKARWGFGGFRIPQTFINLDYSKESVTNKFFSVPRVGFEIESHFYNRRAWSLSKPNNTANTPSWRTFVFTNIFDGKDQYGQDKKLFSQKISNQGNGLENLIVFTEKTAFELVTERIYISSADGNTLQTVGATGLIPLIVEERNLFIAGMPNYLWRFADEVDNALYYCDYISFYRFAEKHEDIGNLYKSKLFNILSSLPTEYSSDLFIAKYVDTKNKEYGFSVSYNGYQNIKEIDGTVNAQYGSIQGCISGATNTSNELVFFDVPLQGTYTYCMSNVGDGDVAVYANLGGLFVVLLFTVEAGKTVTYTITDSVVTYAVSDGLGTCTKCKLINLSNFCVFSQRQEVFNWIGEYNYSFDYFCSNDGIIYGFKDGKRYILDSEEGDAIECYIQVLFAPKDYKFEEFVRFNVSSNKKPDFVYFQDTNEVLTGTVLNANIRPYGSGFEQYIPLNTVTGGRHQNKSLIMKTSYNATTEEVVIRSNTIQYRKID